MADTSLKNEREQGSACYENETYVGGTKTEKGERKRDAEANLPAFQLHVQ